MVHEWLAGLGLGSGVTAPFEPFWRPENFIDFSNYLSSASHIPGHLEGLF